MDIGDERESGSVLMIEGLDTAIIGTSYRDNAEVFVYDFRLSIRILMEAGFPEDEAIDHIEWLAVSEVPKAPFFVYTTKTPDDPEQRPEGTSLH